MTIRRLLKDNKLARPEEVERLNMAYRDVLRSLHLVDRNDPVAEIVAKTVIGIGATGVNEPSEISKIAIERLAIVTAAPERAPPLVPSLETRNGNVLPDPRGSALPPCPVCADSLVAAEASAYVAADNMISYLWTCDTCGYGFVTHAAKARM
jgi:hypothetical protein